MDIDKFRLEWENRPPAPERPTLTEFLIARLEDHQLMKHDSGRYCDFVLPFARYCSRVIQWHEQWPVMIDRPDDFRMEVGQSLDNTIAMHISRKLEWMTREEFRKKFGEEPPTTPLLREMARIFRQHPDYNPEWDN